MKTEKIAIGKLKPSKINPRYIKDNKFKKLVKSIQEFPEMLEIRPIVVNKDMEVLGGNMRLRACQEAGLKEVHIIKAENLTEEQQKEFMIKDNVGFGDWDWDLLANEWEHEKLNNWGLDIINAESTLEEIETLNEPEYPIVPIYDEHYQAVIIIVKNETNLTFIKNALNLQKSKSYKKNAIGINFILTDEEFIKAISNE